MNNQAYFIINSDDRDKSTYPNPANYRVVGRDQSFNVTDIAQLEGTEFTMYYDIPNINERNNTMVVDDGATSYPLTIYEGFYDEIDLATVLQIELIAALGAGQTVVWDTVTKRFTMTTTVPVKVTETGLQLRDLGDMMGFAKDQALTLTNTGGSTDIAYTRNIYVKSNTLHRSKRVQDQATTSITTDLIMTVPVYQPGSVVELPQQIAYQASWPKRIFYNSSDTITSFDLQLLDDQGEYLYNPDTGLNSWKYHMSILATRT